MLSLHHRCCLWKCEKGRNGNGWDEKRMMGKTGEWEGCSLLRDEVPEAVIEAVEVVQRRAAVHRLAVWLNEREKRENRGEKEGVVKGQDKHGEGGHEGGPDGERVLLALDVDRDDLVLADVIGDGTARAREALAHALRAREHCVGNR